MIIKVCGMREPQNIRAIERLGIDMMGFIFHPASPRYVGRRPDYLPYATTRTGVFVDADADTILRRVEEFGLRAVQLHGNETYAAHCAASCHRIRLSSKPCRSPRKRI